MAQQIQRDSTCRWRVIGMDHKTSGFPEPKYMDLNKKLGFDLKKMRFHPQRGDTTDTTAQASYVNIIHKEARSILEEVST